MADTDTFKHLSFSTEHEEVENYQQLSRLAIWSVPLGLLSALAMVSPLLWFIPLVGVAFSLIGLRQINRSPDITGRRLAVTGLTLAILFGTWGCSWTISRRSILNQQARAYALEWLELMRDGDYLAAHQLTLNVTQRCPAGTPLETYYADDPPRDDDPASPPPGLPPGLDDSPAAKLEYFKTNGVPQILVDARGAFEFKFVENVALERDGPAVTTINQRFHVTFSGQHEPQEMELMIEMNRVVLANRAHWQVGQISDPNESG